MKVVNVLPTGAGKTEVMAQTALEFMRTNPGTSVLILSHLSTLTEQTLARFKLRFPRLSVGVMQGKRRPNMMTDVVISTMQTARNPKHLEMMNSIMLKPVKLIMVDETHMLPTTSYEKIQDLLPGIPLVGFTATPFRQKKVMTNVFDEVAFTISLQELIDQGHLVPPVVNTIATESFDPQAIMANIIGIYGDKEGGNKAIVYMKTVDDAKTLRNAFETLGVTARTVTGDISAEARAEIFASFKKGETKILTTVDVLTAGFDEPTIEAIFMPYGTKSPTSYLQRIGRGLRSSPGKTSCRVYMFGDAPTVSAELYEKMNTIVLNAGKTPGSLATFKEDLDLTFWPKGSEVYNWTVLVVEAVARFESLGMETFAKLLNEKAFPPAYLQKLEKLLARLPKKKTSLPHGNKPATEAQQAVLFESGFPSKVCHEITKAEASMMISAIYNRQNDPKGDAKDFTVPDGMHHGKHVSELPHAYRAIVKKRDPEGPLAQLITAWESRARRA